MAGLQDISPMVAKLWVTSAVRAPSLAAAAAASQPAWPPPMTTTSKTLASKALEFRALFMGPVPNVFRGRRQCFT